ncbi:hypothetical protein MMC07_003969 [Pseudocyphellaria aurata]|nr:hypothetical protein [Pseudocyphellaria aurata]
MLLELIHQFQTRPSTADFHLNGTLKALAILLIAVVVILCWRIWAFTVLPAWRPREPQELRYWIPFLGHAAGFFNDFGGTLNYGRQQFGTQTYKLTLCGQKLYIMTSPRDISRIYKSTEALTFDDFMRGMLLRLGASSDAVRRWLPSSGVNTKGHIPGSSDPLPHDYGHLGEQLCRKQLLPGQNLDKLQGVLINNIEQSLQWHKLSGNIVLYYTQEVKTVSLLNWCRDVLLDGATRAFFDESLMQIDPKLFESFYVFDDLSWQLHFGYPRFMSRTMYAAKDQIIDALTVYFKQPQQERKGEVWLIRNLENEMRLLGIEDRDIAAIIMPLYWVINANAYKSCFWTMAYVLSDPSLIADLRAEIAPVLAEGAADLVAKLDRLPLLESVYLESLRLSSSSGTVRKVQYCTDIGDMTLQSGANVVIPYRQLHRNEEVFGANADQFEPRRFLNNKELRRSPSFKPFGGGTTYCPGRFLARNEVMAFLAVLLHRFDVSLVPNQRFPKMDTRKISLALLDPEHGEDLRVNVKMMKY